VEVGFDSVAQLLDECRFKAAIFRRARLAALMTTEGQGLRSGAEWSQPKTREGTPRCDAFASVDDLKGHSSGVLGFAWLDEQVVFAEKYDREHQPGAPGLD
jgi:hypothetical protein